MPRETGKVKWFSNEKGYGFIERDGREDVFVHHSEIEMDGYRTLDAGEPVEFDLVAGEKGPKAQKVVRTSPEGAAVGDRGGMETGPGHAGEPGTDASSTLAEQLRDKLGRRFFGN